MNFAIMAGGTGGHIFPGIAVAKSLQQQGHKIFWLGAQGGMEARIVKQYGIQMTLLPIKALRGKGIVGLMAMPFRLSKAIWQARRFFKAKQIDAAISMGGYVAAPGGFATVLCRTKLIVHEQNSVFGMTNKHLARRADLVLTGFDLDGLYQSNWVGNPVRDSIEAVGDEKIKRETSNEKPLKVLVLGGSLGAQSLNNLIPTSLSQWIENGDIEIKHQCGKDKAAITNAAYGDKANQVEVKEFIQNMSAAYQWADVCICRAGALTIAEISTAGIPAILVPYPHAVDDHQTDNAMSLVNKQAAMIWQESSTEDEFVGLFKQLLDQEKRVSMVEAIKTLRKTQVAQRIATQCEQVVVA